MTSRYLGLVVVPGEYIVKIELEEFASQMRPVVPVRGDEEGAGEGERVVQEGMVPSGMI